MEISPIRMALLLFYSFVFGISVGVFYDANRIIRVLFGERYSGRASGRVARLKLPILKRAICQRPKRRALGAIVVFIGDFLCVLIAALGIIILNYAYNSGIFRMFTLFGTVGGFLLYYHTVGRLVLFISEPLAMFIKYLVFSFFIICGYPFLKIFKLAVQNIRKIVFLFSFTIEKKCKKVYNVKEEVYLVEMSKNGFLDVKIE